MVQFLTDNIKSLTNNYDALLGDGQPVPGPTPVLPEVCLGDVIDKEVVSVSPLPAGQSPTHPHRPLLLAPAEGGPGPGPDPAGEDELVTQPSVDRHVTRPHVRTVCNDVMMSGLQSTLLTLHHEGDLGRDGRTHAVVSGAPVLSRLRPGHSGEAELSSSGEEVTGPSL